MPYSQTRRPTYGRPRPNAYHSAPRRGGGGKSRRPTKQFINPSRFIQAARPITTEEYQPTNQFDDFALHPLIKENITAKGFVKPSKVQDLAIPHGLEGKDVVGIANTGTGKTAAFGLPLLNKLMADKNARTLILAPTRELAAQIEDELRSFGKGSGLFGALVIGGTPMMKQIRELRTNPHVVIGTPGRIKDHVMRGNLKLETFHTIVLDEVDRMVDMGFINDIRFLLGKVAQDRQSLFFSATMDPKIESLVQSFLNQPVIVSAKTGETSDNVEQNIVRYMNPGDKIEKLHDILINGEVGKTLIFDETQRSVEKLGNELIDRGFKADALHGGKTQGQRQRALNRFRSGDVKVLVATDVAARGIDISDITHVINYSTPQTYDDYVHRIGRAGRAGRQGFALTFIDR